jgi:hypothetical protein
MSTFMPFKHLAHNLWGVKRADDQFQREVPDALKALYTSEKEAWKAISLHEGSKDLADLERQMRQVKTELFARAKATKNAPTKPLYESMLEEYRAANPWFSEVEAHGALQ